MRSHALLSMFVVAACTKAAPPPTTPAAVTTTLELGEITLFDGPNAMLKIHADGTTEMGGHSGRMEIKPGETASSDSLPITWKPGPTIRADGTIESAGAAVARVNADGTIVAVATKTTLPFTITSDRVTFTGGAAPISVELTADGKLLRVGAPADPADKDIRVEGANSPGKRRTILVMVGVSLAPGKVTTTTMGSSVQTVPVEPIKD